MKVIIHIKGHKEPVVLEDPGVPYFWPAPDRMTIITTGENTLTVPLMNLLALEINHDNGKSMIYKEPWEPTVVAIHGGGAT